MNDSCENSQKLVTLEPYLSVISVSVLYKGTLLFLKQVFQSNFPEKLRKERPSLVADRTLQQIHLNDAL